MVFRIDYIDEYIRKIKVFTPKHDYRDDMSIFFDYLKANKKQFIEDEENMRFGYIKTIQSAKPPEKVAGNACYDLSYAGDENITIKPGERIMFSTGLILVFPSGYHGFIMPRSGLSWKHGLDVMAGVIDNSFRHTTQVILVNHSIAPYIIMPGDRIAQIELRKDTTFTVVEMTMGDLENNDRGNGFGSSGR